MSSPELLLESHQQTWDTMALIQDPSVPGLGETVAIEAYPEYIQDHFTGRWHQHYLVELDGHRHSVMVTNPFSKFSETDIVFLPGFTQTIDEPGGVGFKFHTELAARRPDERMISIASTGVGRFGDRINAPNQASMENMARQRFGLLRAISGDRPKVLTPLSMGTVVTDRLVDIDLQHDMALNIRGISNYVHALVQPSDVIKCMGVLFPGHVLPDAGRELLDFRNILHPNRILGMGRSLLKLGLGPADMPALAAQMLSLVEGTSLEALRKETDNYRAVITTGSRDPLRQTDVMSREVERNKGRVHLRVIQGRGHGMAFDSVGAAVHIDHDIDRHRLAA